MFCTRLVFVMVLALAAMLPTPSHAQEAPFYPLVCRFPDLTTHARHLPDGAAGVADPLPSTTIKRAPDGGQEMITQFSFRHSVHAAPAGMNMGECAWADRPMNPSEPTVIVFVQEPPVWVYTTRRASIGTPSSPDEIIMLPSPAPWIRCLAPGGYITVQARSVNNADWGGSVLQGATPNHFIYGDCSNEYAPRPSP